jgi:hypothetical protein
LYANFQVVITWLLVAIELAIVIALVVREMPTDEFDPTYLPKRMVLICKSSALTFLAPFGWDLLLISLCTLYAVKSRNLPENFNEAKLVIEMMVIYDDIYFRFIGFTMCKCWFNDRIHVK